MKLIDVKEVEAAVHIHRLVDVGARRKLGIRHPSCRRLVRRSSRFARTVYATMLPASIQSYGGLSVCLLHRILAETIISGIPTPWNAGSIHRRCCFCVAAAVRPTIAVLTASHVSGLEAAGATAATA
eukprot:GHVU01002854.1.p1 GENE.GHVU01002854.1~~GHVU01002854.1.p1  ORF type:complete len:127 (-),score=3.84 GHVU01002854.1:615-995(-)